MAKNEEEALEGEVVTGDLSALAVLAKAEIDANVATAKMYPRSLTAFRKEALEMVTLTEKIAEECIFALPRGKENGKQKFIEGPSVRFSEMIVMSYGNCRSGARVVGEEKDFVIAEGFFHDLEKNVAVKVEVKRRILDKYGKRYNSDMIGVTGNAACSIARRNAALQGIPKAIWSEFYEKARKVAIGDATTLVKYRGEVMAYFQKLSVAPETIFDFLGVKGLEDIGLDELAIIKGIATAIKEGTTTIDRAFIVEESSDKGSRAKEVFDRLKGSGSGAATPTAEPETGNVFEKTVVDACSECGVAGGHDSRCSKSTALPCPLCKEIGKHGPNCPENEPPAN